MDKHVIAMVSGFYKVSPFELEKTHSHPQIMDMYYMTLYYNKKVAPTSQEQ